MCGIFGAISWERPYRDPEPFRKATDRVAHRGPDGSGTVCLTRQGAEDPNSFQVFFGHRRLSILDLDEAANQPMEESGYWIVYNGEIFNYIELRNELKQAGYTFRTDGDTEVVLQGYRHWGCDVFNRLNGMWSIALFDPQLQEVVLSRDRFSIKPLFILRQEGQLMFASEIKQLLPFLDKSRVNEGVLFQFLAQSLTDHTADTFFRDIQRFPASSYNRISLKDGSAIEQPYWTPVLTTFSSQDDFEEAFRALFIDSIRLRLRSDVPLGTLLSGGLDSSAITVLIKEHLNPEIRSFSVVSDSKRYSEERFIDMVAQHSKVVVNKLHFEQDEAMNMVEEVLGFQDEPFITFSIIAQYQLFEQIRKQGEVTVLLSGQGSDEITMGYLKYYFFYLRQLIASGNIPKAMKLLVGAAANGTVLSQFTMREAKRYLPGFIKRSVNYLNFEKHGLYAPAVANMYDRHMLDLNHVSIPGLARYEDRNSMAHSLESRLPFLDHRLVELLLSADPSWKIRNGWLKYPIRSTVTELPDEIRWRKDKLGFTTPEADWWRGPLGEKLLSLLEHSRLADLGFFEPRSFAEQLREYRSGKGVLSGGDIFRVFISEKWLSSYVETA